MTRLLLVLCLAALATSPARAGSVTTTDACPGLADALVTARLGPSEPRVLVQVVRAAAAEQPTAPCAAAALGLGSLLIVQLSGPPTASDDDPIRLLAREAWERHPSLTSGLLRASVEERTLEPTLPREVERVADRWLDVMLVSVRREGWLAQPSVGRALVARQARRFATSQLGSNTHLDRAAWAALRAVTHLSFELDRPTEWEAWRATFPPGATPKETDLLLLTERQGLRRWADELPWTPFPDARPLAAAVYWRDRLRERDSAESTPETWINKEFLAGTADGGEGMCVRTFSRLLADLATAPAALPIADQLAARPPTAFWSPARQGALASRVVHARLSTLTTLASEEDWAELERLFEELAALAPIEAAQGETEFAPYGVGRVADEAARLLTSQLQQGTHGRLDRLADPLVRLSERSPYAAHAATWVAARGGAELTVARRRDLAAATNRATLQPMGQPRRLEGTLLRLLDHLVSAALLDQLAAADPTAPFPSFTLDPGAFEARFAAPLVDAGVVRAQLTTLTLPPSGCQLVFEVTDPTVVGGVRWDGLGFLPALPGAAGSALTEELRALAATIESKGECPFDDEDAPTPFHLVDPADTTAALVARGMSSWLGVTNGVAGLAGEDPARLGLRYPVEQLVALLPESPSAAAPDGVSLRCRAAESLERVGEAQAATSLLAGPGPSRCDPPGTPAAAFLDVPVRVLAADTDLEVIVTQGPYAGEISAWTTHALQAGSSSRSFVVTALASGTSSLRAGAWECPLAGAILTQGLTLYGHRAGCVAGLPQTRRELP